MTKPSFSGKLILVTGIPGVGKTTISRLLENRLDPFQRVGFGQLLFEVKQEAAQDIVYETLRQTPTANIPLSDVKKAKKNFINQTVQILKKKHIILDSHAVVNDYYGFRVIPEISNKELRLDAVINLHANLSVVQNRIQDKSEGRKQSSLDELKTHEQLQDALCMAYSLVLDCPVYVVNSSENIEKVQEDILNIFQNLGISYTFKR